jgi:hypothetical protein
VAFLKKYELEATDLVAGLNRCQNPIYLRFAEAAEIFLKDLVNGYVAKFFKSGIGMLVVSRTAFFVFFSRVVVVFLKIVCDCFLF